MWVDLIVLSEIKMTITDANLGHGHSVELVRADSNSKDWKNSKINLEGTAVLK